MIYHASLIGQAAPKNKGKMSRILAAKASLATRVDAMGSSDDATIGITARAKVGTPKPETRFAKALKDCSVLRSTPNPTDCSLTALGRGVCLAWTGGQVRRAGDKHA